MPKHPRVKSRKLGREKAAGLYHSDGLIEIDERLTGKERLDTLIHEYWHHLDAEADEETINKKAALMADFLWKNRVRIIDSDK
jgi:hypothetical protein